MISVETRYILSLTKSQFDALKNFLYTAISDDMSDDDSDIVADVYNKMREIA